jgi:hypothetical protein
MTIRAHNGGLIRQPVELTERQPAYLDQLTERLPPAHRHPFRSAVSKKLSGHPRDRDIALAAAVVMRALESGARLARARS